MNKIGYGILLALLGLSMCMVVSCSKGISNDKMPGTPEKVQRVINLFPASIHTVNGTLWGYVDNKGEYVIKPVFGEARDFAGNGLAIVRKGNLYGVIDSSEKYVVEPRYEYINDYNEGLAVASVQKRYIVLDEKGHKIFDAGSTQVSYISDFHEGRAVFSSSEAAGKWRYGYLDTEGKVIIGPKYESAGSFKNGKAVVGFDGGGYGLIGKNGEILKSFDYPFVGEPGDGMLSYREKEDGKYGYIDEKGKVMIKPQFSLAEAFKDGRAVVNNSDVYYTNKYGLIDRKGKFIIKPEFNDIRDLGEGLYAVGKAIDKEYTYKGSIYAIADREGKFLTDFIYYGIEAFRDGYASVYNNSMTFFVDRTGKRVDTLPSVKGIGQLKLEGDLVKAYVDNRTSYYDKSGSLIWRQNMDIVLNDQITVKEEKYRPNRNYLVYYPQIEGMENKGVQAGANNRLKEMSIPHMVDSNTNMEYEYHGDFKVTFFRKNLLVLELSGYEYPFGAAHGMPELVYAHVDLKSGRFYELKDLFKKDSDYLEKLSAIVKKEMEKPENEVIYWMDSYKGIKENQPFIITKDALKLYFHPYEIAAYAAGFPTFTIPYREIMHWIDTQGALWKAFN